MGPTRPGRSRLELAAAFLSIYSYFYIFFSSRSLCILYKHFERSWRMAHVAGGEIKFEISCWLRGIFFLFFTIFAFYSHFIFLIFSRLTFYEIRSLGPGEALICLWDGPSGKVPWAKITHHMRPIQFPFFWVKFTPWHLSPVMNEISCFLYTYQPPPFIRQPFVWCPRKRFLNNLIFTSPTTMEYVVNKNFCHRRLDNFIKKYFWLGHIVVCHFGELKGWKRNLR